MQSALVDTSFLITLADGARPRHATAWQYFNAFAAHGTIVYLSAVVIAEFSVRQSIDSLGLRHFVPLAFTPEHAIEAGRLQNLIQRDADPCAATRRAIVRAAAETARLRGHLPPPA